MNTKQPDVNEDFEHWARVAASLVGLDEASRRRRLSELGLTQQWSAAEEKWAGTITQELLGGGMDHFARYAAHIKREHESRPLQGKVATNDFRRATALPTVKSAVLNRTADDLEPAIRPIGGLPFTSDPADREVTMRGKAKQIDQTAPLKDLGVRGNEPKTAKADHHPSGAGALQWTVDRYACFRAELLHSPQQHDPIGQRYGLNNEGERQHAIQQWDERLQLDQQLQARFEQLLQHYRQHFASSA